MSPNPGSNSLLSAKSCLSESAEIDPLLPVALAEARCFQSTPKQTYAAPELLIGELPLQLFENAPNAAPSATLQQ